MLKQVKKSMYNFCDMMVVYSQTAGKRLANGGQTARKRLDPILSRMCLASLICLCMLTMGVGNAWADAIPTTDLLFSTESSVRIVNEDFNSVSTVDRTATMAASSSLSGYGVFNYGYNNSTSNHYAIESSTFSSNALKITMGSGSPCGVVIGGKTYGTSGAFRFKTTKTAKFYIGLYKTDGANATLFAKKNGSVYLQCDAGAISINDGDGMKSVGSYTSDIIDICVVYNNTGSSTTYCSGEITLASKCAHVYINGYAVMNVGGTAPKDFTIPGASLEYFRVYPINTSGYVACVDDLQIWNALPASSCTNKITWDTPSPSGGKLTFGKSSGIKTCNGGNSVIVTVEPNKGYKCTALSFAVSTGDVSIEPEIPATGTIVSYPSTQVYTLTFAEDQNATLTPSVTFATNQDQFKDIMHGNSISNKSGNYNSMPAALSDETPGDDYCSEKHYKFAGWVVESDINTEDGTLKPGATIVPAGESGHYATGVTWYAVWAKENEVE